ncbi:tripartite-type tricarboxylate transporter receptor subunit TctC [Variovorax boronicumulans]|uniref:Bug family tripartite tricarboxylate transporter substrate binding protein n=1 Tax=Variovorax boronicumulans TaxID=436515 RepID=UPI00277D5205|nr:tripartite tricarboxylate transporter substrate binding protein [Variovorax boronicumulans]MDP9912551.1 tripartite-type tricarboxylate transporter receptor subunit TctC [Variovorax boronicumulans]
MSFKRREVVRFAAAAATVLAARGTRAQSWPSRPVTLVVAFPAGGDTDAVARIYAEKLTSQLKQPVIVENRPGAGGAIGTAYVAKAAPDGHTLLYAPSPFVIAPHVLRLSGATRYSAAEDFTPVIKDARLQLVLVTATGTGIKRVEQLIAEAKAGKALSYASPGAGSPMHIVGEMLNKAAGVSIAHVPYRGSAPVVADVLGAHVPVGWVTPGTVVEHIRAGRLRALAVAGSDRSRVLPDVPTLTELGYKGIQVDAWQGLLGPRGLAPGIVRTLNQHMNEILKMRDVVARLMALSIEPAGGEPIVLAQQIVQDDERFGKLVKEFGIRAD